MNYEPLTEEEFLKDEASYLKDIFDCTIDVYSAEDPKIYDPNGKARFAEPLRPAIYVE